MRTIICILWLSACGAPVLPHERGRLAAKSMVPPFSSSGAGDYRDKVVQTRTGGALPGAVAGGGCGCTQ